MGSSLTLRDVLRLKLFENRVFRRIFGLKRDEVTREWRKLHNKSLMICITHPILFG
jgi:putative NADPH-quinone reductase